jgi:hypothetical protein
MTAGWVAMAEARALSRKVEAVVAECLRCRTEFEPRKAGHVFCSRECRHRNVRKEGETVPPSEEELERLFDPARDPDGRVDRDDWNPTSWSPGWVELDLCKTVADRRRWYRALVREGVL